MKNLRGFGIWAADHITNQLANIEDLDIVTTQNVQNNLVLASPGNTTNAEFAKATGAEIVLVGRYYVNNDQLVVHASLNGASDGQLIQSFEIEGSSSDLQGVLNLLSQRILGYWVSKDHPSFSRRPPNFEAYQYFLKRK